MKSLAFEISILSQIYEYGQYHSENGKYSGTVQAVIGYKKREQSKLNNVAFSAALQFTVQKRNNFSLILSRKEGGQKSVIIRELTSKNPSLILRKKVAKIKENSLTFRVRTI